MSWWNSYREMKVQMFKEGYKLLTSQRGFKQNYNIYRLKENQHINESQAITEFLALQEVIKRGGNIVSNITVSTPAGDIARINKYWLEKNSAIEIEKVDKRNTSDLGGINTISIHIPDEVKKFFKERRAEWRLLEGW